MERKRRERRAAAVGIVLSVECDNCGELLRDVCVGREKNRQLFGCRLREEKREFGTLRDDWRWRSRRWLHR